MFLRKSIVLSTLFLLFLSKLALASTPQAGSISPAFGSCLPDQAVTFTTTYTDPSGYQDITLADLLINPLANGTNGFYGYYDRPSNKLYLRNDANTSWIGGFAPGSTNTIENSYVKLNCALSTVLGSGTTLTVKWNISFKASFVSTTAKNSFLYVKDKAGYNSGWIQRGTYLIGPNSAPQAGTISPNSGSTLPDQEAGFSCTYIDPNGWQDLQYLYLLINPQANGTNGFYGYYNQNENKLYLRNDANTSWTGGFAPGSANTIENSYCKLNCTNTKISGSGTTLAVKWAVTFKTTYIATTVKNLYLYAKDDSGAVTNWIQKGTYLVGPNSSPQVGTISPNSGSTQVYMPVTFTTTYTDPNGWQDIQYVFLLINTSTSSYTNCFFGYYNQNTNKLYLKDDAASSTYLGGFAPGSANTIENSYVKIDCSKTTVSGSATTLTVKWNITFKPGFAATTAKNTCLYVRDDSNLYQGWIQKGTWEIKSVSAVSINNGAPYTNLNLVTLNLYPSIMDKPSQMKFSNDGSTWSSPESYSISKAWLLAPGDDIKTVYVKFMDVNGIWSQVYSDTIILDTVAPSTQDSGISDVWTNNPVTVMLAALDITSAVVAPDSYTKLLLHCDGNDSSIVFSDASFVGNSLIANGNAQIDTEQKKFGSGSGLFNGINSYLISSDNDNWSFGSGDFTIDYWVKFNAISSVNNVVFLSQVSDSNYWYTRKDSNNGQLRFAFIANGVVKGNYVTVDNWISSVGTWYHLAFVRNGATAKIFIDGKSQDLIELTAFGSNDVGNILSSLSIGCWIGDYSDFLNGWIDEFRISKGIARWTANFNPEPTVSSGVNKIYYSTDGSTPNTVYISPFTIINEGNYTIKYYSTDNAGNVEAVRTAINHVKIDKTPPVTCSIIINNGDATVDNSKVNLTLSATDSASGMGAGAQMQFSNDNVTWGSPQDYAASVTWQLSEGFGAKTVYAEFKDVAGNWSGKVSDTVELLNVPKERIYVYLNGQRVAMEENGKKFFYHNDHLGGTNIVTDESGQQVKHIEYQPYGDTKLEEGPKKLSRKFTGKELDEETGLYDYGARQYDAKTGRFITPDPLEILLTRKANVSKDALGFRFRNTTEQNLFIALLHNPQNLNKYSYCLNNPINYIDPTGLWVAIGEKPVRKIGSHTVIILHPDNPNDFKNYPGAKWYKTKTGEMEATFSANPAHGLRLSDYFGNLTATPSDSNDRPDKLKTIRHVSDPQKRSDTQVIKDIIKSANKYKNDLPYDPIPWKFDPFYNSNSYAYGILKDAKISNIPNLRGWQPGADKPIPLKEKE